MMHDLVLEGMLRAVHESLIAKVKLKHVRCPHCGCSHVDEHAYDRVAHSVHICHECREQYPHDRTRYRFKTHAVVSNPLSELGPTLIGNKVLFLGLPTSGGQLCATEAAMDLSEVSEWLAERGLLVDTMDDSARLRHYQCFKKMTFGPGVSEAE